MNWGVLQLRQHGVYSSGIIHGFDDRYSHDADEEKGDAQNGDDDDMMMMMMNSSLLSSHVGMTINEWTRIITAVDVEKA